MRTCERLVKEGRFTPSNPVGILTSGYYELLQNKVPLLGQYTQRMRQKVHSGLARYNTICVFEFLLRTGQKGAGRVKGSI